MITAATFTNDILSFCTVYVSIWVFTMRYSWNLSIDCIDFWAWLGLAWAGLGWLGLTRKDCWLTAKGWTVACEDWTGLDSMYMRIPGTSFFFFLLTPPFEQIK